MSKAPYLPERGDIIWLVLDPRVGHEQSGHRPALVLSDRLMAESTGLALICPITSTIKGLPFEVVLAGTKTAGAVLTIQLRSVDVLARKATFIEKAPPLILKKVSLYVQVLLGV